MQARPEKKKFAEKAAREHRRLLLISDSPNLALVSSLEAAGFKIVGQCAAVATAIALRRSRPQLVIADHELTGLTTAEVALLLKQSQDAIPFILTGSEPATLVQRQKAMTSGAFDYFQIPAEIDLLILRVDQLVTLRQTIDRLRGEADLDQLTGLANRRRFRVALSREIERWHRYGVPCSLVLLDIDHMKLINDTHGHPAGDAVIREIAGTLGRVSRDNDTAARLGGEEFALLLAGIGAAKAEAAARRLLEILAGQKVAGVGNFTVSIGVAACPEHADSERTLYAASDRALYVSKNGGRNRIAVAPLLQQKLPGV